MSFEKAFSEVKRLVEKFEKGQTHYLGQSYKEQEARQDFIDNFFIALGWDVRHEEQHDPYQQEVKVERTEKNQKRTDYAFFLNPNYKDPKFFAEAKKPSQNLRNADYYFQTIRYGWNANTPVAALTDFEEFVILDCRYRPDISTVLSGQHKYFHYQQYKNEEVFKEIYYLFSREAVSGGSLERYSDGLPKPRGKAVQKGLFKGGYKTIGDEFLEYIDEVRESLAKAFKKNDQSLTSEELTEATQKTIDRLVFIRFLEDKLIEQNNYVSELGDNGNGWADFIAASRQLDAKYNGVVFKEHFIDKKTFKGPDPNEFLNICDEISHVNSPYDFNAIPIHILGSIYERFLGKVVHATDKRVKVEEKPEVRDAGGVFYTPKHIVDNIVANTIGEALKGKTPEAISKLRFADIACGSGSFLISVFEFILDYHHRFYQKNPEKAKKDGCIEVDGRFVLTIKQKQKILTNNIYGVDIDQQAVEVTQLSLALKMLEDETTATANEMQVLFHEKILPDLTKNIICGNSLIGTDILEQSLFGGSEESKLNPMDYETALPKVMESGGFDVIVGNPPWSSKMPNEYNKYIGNKFGVDSKNLNLFAPFILNGIRKIKKDGVLALLIPKVFIKNTSYSSIRKQILDSFTLTQLIDFGKFPGVASDCVCPIIKNKKPKNENGSLIQKVFDGQLKEEKTINQNLYLKNPVYAFSFDITEEISEILDKIKLNSSGLGSIAFVKRGIELGQTSNLVKCPSCSNYNEADQKYYNLKESKVCKHCKTKIPPAQTIISISSRSENDKYKLKCVSGKEISKYGILSNYFIPKKLTGIDYKDEIFSGDRVFVKRISTKPEAVFIPKSETLYSFNTVYSIYNLKGVGYQFLTGILNSKLMEFYYEHTYNLGMNLTTQITIEYLKELPIKNIDIKDKNQKDIHDKIENLVNQLTVARKTFDESKTDRDLSYYGRRVEELTTSINIEVYKLYDLAPDERQIVSSAKFE